MKLPGAIYLVLAALGVFTSIAVPVYIYHSGSDAIPAWNKAVSPGLLSAPHAFLSNKCASCHAPDRGIAAVKCISCHALAPELLTKPNTAFHANARECRGCHVEHQGVERRPIRMNHAVLEKVTKKAGGSPVSLDCESCHSFQDKHQAFFGQECAACHSTDSWKIAGFLHPSPRSRECVQCHKAPPSHKMMHFDMMDKMITGQKRARVDQCFACHQTDSFNNIKGVGWYKMH